MTGGTDKPQNQAELEGLYAQSFKELESGELVRGRVVHISADNVVVDIGYKTEGHIPRREFLDKDGNLAVAIGDEVVVLFVGPVDEDSGFVALSKAKADQLKVWVDIVDACDKGTKITGVITQRVKGGFYVDLNGVLAFLPGSQVDIRPVRSPDALIGSSFEFRVLKHNRRKNNVIVSRRVILEEERDAKRKETLERLSEGAVVEGVVKNITDYGAFVDLGGIDGLVHLTDISWGKVSHPAAFLKVGETVKVKVISFNRDDAKISLSIKDTMPNPWEAATDKYPPGSKVKGRVTSLMDYGAFVQLEEGLEGLVHISEMSWTKIKHPSQKLVVGDEVDVKVKDVDARQRKISLSLKDAEANPWDDLETRYPLGSRVKGPVKNVTSFGVFVEIEEGVDGLVHVSDLSWKKVRHPAELYKKGDAVEAVVKSIDRDARRFSLSTKALEKNPWEGVEARYRPGMIVEGRVTSIADFGAFVAIEDGLEGLVHVSELARGQKKGATVAIGAVVEVEVLNVDPDDKKIGLSLRAVREAPPSPGGPEDTGG